MLHTPASSENIPLFSTELPTSLPMSCRTEGRLIIQRPLYESADFGWSDFPVVQQQDMFEDFSSSSPQTPIEDEPACPPMPQREDDLSTASFDSLLTTSTSSSTNSLSSAASNSNSSSGSNGRRVKFADNIQVRTHTIVLGDHPCCKSLPLELGWEYDEGEAALKSSNRQPRRRGTAARRRPYLERKAMLKNISGMTDAEIKYIVTSKLRPVGPSSNSLNTLGYDL